MEDNKSDSVIGTIIREISYECAEKNHKVSDTLIAFIVKAAVINPDNQFFLSKTLTKESIQKLIKICINRLLSTDDANEKSSMETIKMQVYFDMNYASRSDFLSEHRNVMIQGLTPIMKEIVETKAGKKDDLERLYRKIVSYILLKSGLGSPTNIVVVRETTAALQSVFPISDIGTFLALCRKDKERQLGELTQIISGIRLFNKDIGKGGKDIEDVATLLNQAIPTTSEQIDKRIIEAMKLSSIYTALLEDGVSQGRVLIPKIRLALINTRQYEVFMRIILNDIIISARHVEAIEKELVVRLAELKQSIESKNAVPTAVVYPQFVHLADLWIGLQDEMILLGILNNILYGLQTFVAKIRNDVNLDELSNHLTSLEILTDEQRIERSSHNRINAQEMDGDWIFPNNTNNFSTLALQFRGFCAATIMSEELLLPANPTLGILRYKNEYYAFSDKNKAYQFAQDPDRFIHGIINQAKITPELIQLLELQEHFTSLIEQKKQHRKRPRIQVNSGTQTDTHILDSNIDRNYTWNEWEMRRMALKLANLRNKVTKSMQTNSSNFRRDNATQHYPQKEVGTTTKKEESTVVPRPQVYLIGLRGILRSLDGDFKPTDMKKLDLTVDKNDAK
ncbi:hypothetical protein SNEBB_007020 [Seison nebaliae]|nr:hypothetical protein SNEBB_007020 [Seison nebaliae]